VTISPSLAGSNSNSSSSLDFFEGVSYLELVCFFETPTLSELIVLDPMSECVESILISPSSFTVMFNENGVFLGFDYFSTFTGS
jgi:hypothetical protein